MLKLRDPADETNDLGRRIVALKHVQATFKKLNRRLLVDLKENHRPSLLAPFLRGVYNKDQRARREQLSSYGWSLSKAGRQYASSDLSKEANENTGTVTEDAYAIPGEPLSADRGELDAIAQSIRKYRGPVRKVSLKDGPVTAAENVSQAYEEAEKHVVADIEAAKEAAKTDDVQGINTWLKDIEEASEHKQTGEVFADILGLNRKADK